MTNNENQLLLKLLSKEERKSLTSKEHQQIIDLLLSIINNDYNYSVLNPNSISTARDIANDIFTSIWQSRSDIKAIHPNAYLKTICRHEIYRINRAHNSSKIYIKWYGKLTNIFNALEISKIIYSTSYDRVYAAIYQLPLEDIEVELMLTIIYEKKHTDLLAFESPNQTIEQLLKKMVVNVLEESAYKYHRPLFKQSIIESLGIEKSNGGDKIFSEGISSEEDDQNTIFLTGLNYQNELDSQVKQTLKDLKPKIMRRFEALGDQRYSPKQLLQFCVLKEVFELNYQSLSQLANEKLSTFANQYTNIYQLDTIYSVICKDCMTDLLHDNKIRSLDFQIKDVFRLSILNHVDELLIELSELNPTEINFRKNLNKR